MIDRTLRESSGVRGPWVESPPGLALLDREQDLSAGTDTGHVRPLLRGDLPAIVALRQHVFRRTERSSPRDLAAYLDRIFFESPIGGAAARDSLVYEDAQGRLAGFLGVIPRRMFLGNRSIRVSVGTQLMVAPEAPGLVGRRLMRALCDGPQDLVLADTANDAARRLWDSIGGHTAVSYSLSWYRPLRPLRFAAMRGARGLLARAASASIRPALAIIDAVLTAPASARPAVERSDEVSELVVQDALPEMHSMLAAWELRPGYSADLLQWIVGQVALKRGCGPVRARMVHDARGRPVGWFMYCGERGEIGQVVQLGAGKQMYGRVLAHLFDDAHARGLVGLVGRLEPRGAPDLTASGARFFHEGAWVLAYARDRSLIGVIESGRAFVSRLDGEWWLGF